MNENGCAYEEAVTRSGGAIEGPLAEHVRGCQSCQENAAVAGWMTQLRAQSRPRKGLPTPEMLWLKSRVMQIQDAQLRAVDTIRIVHVIVYGFVGLCWSVFLTWKGSAISQWFGDIRSGHFVSAITGSSPISISFLLMLGALICMTVVATLPAILAEE
ncbi:MAG: hypothetical protein ABI718_01125 [Acidobacteriota bacterium]